MSGQPALRLGILISGRGTNMAAIARQCREGRIGAQVAIVISERPEAAGLTTATSAAMRPARHWRAIAAMFEPRPEIRIPSRSAGRVLNRSRRRARRRGSRR